MGRNLPLRRLLRPDETVDVFQDLALPISAAGHLLKQLVRNECLQSASLVNRSRVQALALCHVAWQGYGSPVALLEPNDQQHLEEIVDRLIPVVRERYREDEYDEDRQARDVRKYGEEGENEDSHTDMADGEFSYDERDDGDPIRDRRPLSHWQRDYRYIDELYQAEEQVTQDPARPDQRFWYGPGEHERSAQRLLLLQSMSALLRMYLHDTWQFDSAARRIQRYRQLDQAWREWRRMGRFGLQPVPRHDLLVAQALDLFLLVTREHLAQDDNWHGLQRRRTEWQRGLTKVLYDLNMGFEGEEPNNNHEARPTFDALWAMERLLSYILYEFPDRAGLAVGREDVALVQRAHARWMLDDNAFILLHPVEGEQEQATQIAERILERLPRAMDALRKRTTMGCDTIV